MIRLVNVVIFGATGMVGQGVLRECLLDQRVDGVVTLGRNATGQHDPKLRELVHRDLLDFRAIEPELSGLDACFFCLGVSAAGMTEEQYRRVTYDITIAAAESLVRLNTGMTFIYVSGVGTDSTEKGRTMWARVKGATENALLRMPFKGAYMFRPGMIQPLHGIKSRTRLYRVGIAVMNPFFPLLRRMFPRQILNTEEIGRAMIEAALHGVPKPILEPPDIKALVSPWLVRRQA
jgi:uncharacterized protein YbjT (DUF2867 family)